MEIPSPHVDYGSIYLKREEEVGNLHFVVVHDYGKRSGCGLERIGQVLIRSDDRRSGGLQVYVRR